MKGCICNWREFHSSIQLQILVLGLFNITSKRLICYFFDAENPFVNGCQLARSKVAGRTEKYDPRNQSIIVCILTERYNKVSYFSKKRLFSCLNFPGAAILNFHDAIRLPPLSCCLLSCLVLSCLVLSCLVLSCLVLSCLVLSCLVLSCLVLSCLVLSCLVLSCLVVCYLSTIP